MTRVEGLGLGVSRAWAQDFMASGLGCLGFI